MFGRKKIDPDAPITGLVVTTGGVFQTDLATAKNMDRPNRRAPLYASVDPRTGEVTLSVKLDDIDKLR